MNLLSFNRFISSLIIYSFFFGACNRKEVIPAERFPTKIITKTNTKDSIADVIIYGGTSSAIVSAIESKIMGKSVILISPDKHLGGMTTSGLGWTDVGNKNVIGGLSKEFYHRIFAYYQQGAAWNWQNKESYSNLGQGTAAIDNGTETMWVFEPHVAEKIFGGWLQEYNIPIYTETMIDQNAGVHKIGNRINYIQTISGKKFYGKMFIDATYEGDLMAEAGVSYTVGRESNGQYNEKWNGVQTTNAPHHHDFNFKISPYIIPDEPKSGILYGVSDTGPGEYGSGDKKVQAYCFRTCLTNNASNLTSFPRPENYDSTKYEILLRLLNKGSNDYKLAFSLLPNLKIDNNNNGAFSLDFIGENYDYPNASYSKRNMIIKAHENYQKGYYYFLTNDQRIPLAVRTWMHQWGLAKDEFTDNGNWPYLLYIREARRMIGSYVLTENDVLESKNENSIGMGSYTLDSHNVQRYIANDYIRNEGNVEVAVRTPYTISYYSIIPKETECSNLLVPVCLSASHIAYGSIRMEPIAMILGQSAAAAASLAIDKGVDLQKLDYSSLQEMLIKQNQVLQ